MWGLTAALRYRNPQQTTLVPATLRTDRAVPETGVSQSTFKSLEQTSCLVEGSDACKQQSPSVHCKFKAKGHIHCKLMPKGSIHRRLMENENIHQFVSQVLCPASTSSCNLHPSDRDARHFDRNFCYQVSFTQIILELDNGWFSGKVSTSHCTTTRTCMGSSSASLAGSKSPLTQNCQSTRFPQTCRTK